MKIIRLILNILLTLAIIAVGYYLYNTVKEPIEFDTASSEIKGEAVTKLKTIRTIQLAHKAVYNRYASDFDSLIMFVKTDSFEVLREIGDPNDSTTVVQTEKFKIAIADSLFKGDAGAMSGLRYVPNTDNKEEFKMRAEMVTKNEVTIPAFQASVPYEVLYDGLVKKYYQDKVGRSLRVGSISDGTTSGNWE